MTCPMPAQPASATADPRKGTVPEATPATRPLPPAARGPSSPAPSARPNLLGLLMALRRRWLLAFGLGVLCAAPAAAAAWYLLPTTSTVRTLLHVAASPPKILFDTPDGRTDFTSYQRAQVALIRTRFVLTRALRDPAVGRLGVLQGRPDPVNWLEKQIQVDYALAPDILRIAMTGEHPDELARLVNAVRDAYVKEIADKEYYQRFARLDQLKKLYEKYDTFLQDKRKKLREMAESLGSRDSKTLAVRQQFALAQLNTLQTELLGLQSQLRKAQLELAEHQDREKTASEAAVPEAVLEAYVKADKLVQHYEDQLTHLESALAQVRARARKPESEPAYKVSTAALKNARKALEGRRQELRPLLLKKIREEARRQLELARAEHEEQFGRLRKLEQLLSKEVKERGQDLHTFKKGTIDLEWLRDEIGQVEDVHRTVGKQKQALEVEIEAPQRVKLLEEATVSEAQGPQRRVRGGAMAGLAAFGLVVFGVALLEFRKQRVNSADEVAQALGMKLVGILPLLPERVRRSVVGAPGPRDLYWHNLFTEALNAARTSLLHTARRESLRTLMVTSALEGEGKTLVSCHLAASLARAGYKVLLVDGDLRRPSVDKQLRLAPGPGFSELLRGAAEDGQAVRPGPVQGLSVLPAGQRDEATMQALAQGRAAAVWARLRDAYDFILIDSPPVLPVADSLLIGQHADGVIFSVLRDVSRLSAIYAAHERLVTLNVRILGAVVNGGQGAIYRSTYPHKQPAAAKA